MLCPVQVSCRHLLQWHKRDTRDLFLHGLRMTCMNYMVQGSCHYSKAPWIDFCSLLLTLASAKDLLLACGRGWRWMGTVVTIPLPAPEKKATSNFDLLVKKLSWNLDMIHFALELRKNIGFNWDESSCRRVLVLPGNGTGVAAAGKSDLVDSKRLARKDPKDFLSKLMNGSVLTSEESFAAVLKKRLEISVVPYEGAFPFVGPSGTWNEGRSPISWLPRWLNPGAGPHVPAAETDHPELALALERFRIPHLDPIIQKNSKPLGAGSSKSTFKRKWCGMVVAIGVTTTRIEVVKKEALSLLRLQHPNVVGFLGWGFFYPLLPAAATSPTQAATLCEENTGFIVMELMERDLGSEIQRLNLIKSCPFSLPVAVDILQQIVEAMVHVHNLDHAYRDLKVENCLVNRRSLMEYNTQALTNSLQLESDSYIVKLIDFGTCKWIDPESQCHTIKCGTPKCMAPEVLGRTGELWVKQYDPKSADVFSFGMVCYEVITGKTPFGSPSALKKTLDDKAYKRGRRPLFSIPDTISCPGVLKELISRCCTYKPIHRPDFKRVQKDLWRIKTDLEIRDVKTTDPLDQQPSLKLGRLRKLLR